MNASRNIDGQARGLAEGLGVEPFGARSLLLSVLLGLNPPQLPAKSLVSLGELFGIAPGTTRTALSRMVAAGELHATDATYELTGRLLGRKEAQDAGRHPAPPDWDGTWWIVIVTSERRTVAERRLFRSTMANARMGELRPDTWLRPANLMPPPANGGTLVARSELDGADVDDLAKRLWDFAALEQQARRLLDRVDTAQRLLGSGEPSSLVETMRVSAAVVRFLRTDPLMPLPLRPSPWAADDLREAYEPFDRAFGRVLRRFLDDPEVT